MKNLIFKITILAVAYCSTTRTFASPCHQRFAQSNKECEALKSWKPSSFTSIDQLNNASSFRILYHSIAGSWDKDEGRPEAESWTEKLLSNPSLISKKCFESMASK